MISGGEKSTDGIRFRNGSHEKMKVGGIAMVETLTRW